MRKVSSGPSGFSYSHLLATSAIAVFLAACSSSAERFADNPSDSDPVYTASVPSKAPVARAATHKYGADADTITSRPLAGATGGNSAYVPKYNYASAYKAPAYKAPSYTTPAYTAPNYGKAAGSLADTASDTVSDSVNESASQSMEALPKTYNRTVKQPVSAMQDKVASASTVRVEPGMTLFSIARTHGVSVTELAAANHLRPPYAVSKGQVIRLPGGLESKSAAAPESESRPSASTAPVRSAAAETHKVAPGETLFSLGRKYNMSPYAIADANHLPHNQILVTGQSVRIPGSASAGTVAARSKTPAIAHGAQVADNATADEEMTAAPKTQLAKKSLAADEQQPSPAQNATPSQVAAADSNPAISGLRWPVKGKVISEFGPKPGGMKNAGINIAVPEGTGIRAADSGVVAYAGNELKSYGNLVLIRHQGGWVTAYAHAKELYVKKGDTVKRGDVIAKAGQTGSVSSPQLHFEVRQGATAVDPMKFLNSATASN